MHLIITVVAFAVALGTLIIVHELGHYTVARWCGVKVLRFSVGFGRALASRRIGRDGTQWVLAAFPLGGYVKMLDEREGEVAPEERHRAFNRQPVRRRFAIVLAGPLANFLLAVAVYWLLFMHGVPGSRPVVDVPLPGTPAAAAAIHSGDTIVGIAGRPVRTWEEVRLALLKEAVARRSVDVEARSDDGAVQFHKLDLSGLGPERVTGDFLDAVGLQPLKGGLKPVIETVIAGGAAERAGIQVGDRVLAVNGTQITSWDQLVKAIRASPGVAVELTVRRASGERLVVRVTPDVAQENATSIGRIGVGPFISVRYPAGAALWQGASKTWDMSLFTLEMLGRMIIGEVSLKNLSGPITIADYAGQSAQMGWMAYVSFIALISISLGVLNLLPVPVLDGGHLMYYVAEIVRGRPVSDRALEIGQRIGMVVLFSLMAFAIYNDIYRLVGG
ncbi:MAG TPA: RIP metalloprotease RseP [Burkholderiales bacterium]|nr:RIP metalloprotease RseP [Burkholderiales bacterium]